MRIEIQLEQLPAGYCVTAVRGPGEVDVQVFEFTSTEDGQHFIDRLEGYPTNFLRQIGGGWDRKAGGIETMLVIVRRDKTALVAINETRPVMSVQVKRAISAGDPVFLDDIADLQRVSLRPFVVPPDAGYLYVFSSGWRKGLLYDFSPLTPNAPKEREYDLELMLGRCYAELLFQERFRIREDEWQQLFDQQWFPFAYLKHSTLREMIAHIRSGWSVDDLLEKVSDEVADGLVDRVAGWSTDPIFAPHATVINRAVDRFQDSDFISVTALLYPRIEGLIRSYIKAQFPTMPITQATMSDVTVSSRADGHGRSLLLPDKFKEYMQSIYFAHFDPNDSTITVSRNSVAHGVADGSSYARKAAVIAFLILHQLRFYFAPLASGDGSEESAESQSQSLEGN